MEGSESPSLTVWTPCPAFARVVGLPFLLAPVEDAVLAVSACLSDIFTSARIGSPLGWNILKATVSWVQTALKVTTEPHWKVTNGGTACALPAPCPPGTSIILNSLSVVGRMLDWLPSRDTSSSRLSDNSRGLPPPNWAFGSVVPVTGSYFHWLDFETEYSVGLK